jgi:hypothetical protein
MIEKSKKNKKGVISEEDVSTLLQRYEPFSFLFLFNFYFWVIKIWVFFFFFCIQVYSDDNPSVAARSGSI